MSEKEIVPVNICRKEYRIVASEWQPLYIQKLAEIYNKEIEQAESEGLVSTHDILVLSALRIVDKLLKEKERKSENSQVNEAEFSDLLAKIDDIL